MRPTLTTILSILLFAAACAPKEGPAAAKLDSYRADSIARAQQDSINRTLPGYVVDSILPVAEELRRFRIAIGGKRVTTLRRASNSREALVTRFVTALAHRDSVELQAMVLDAREFADLVYPESPYVRPPYRQPPGLVWTAIQNPSRSGLTRLIRRLGGEPLRYQGSRCAGKPDRQGQNLIWTGCLLSLASQDGRIARHRLFGSIIAREGRFKIVSYANEF